MGEPRNNRIVARSRWGFVALFAGFEQFFLIWLLGFVVLVPIVALLTGGEMPPTLGNHHAWIEQTSEREQPPNEDDTPATQDALTTLRERYARGDLTDEQFDRKLTRLLQTETPESAAEWRKRETEAETE